jgi:hypothetical protein
MEVAFTIGGGGLHLRNYRMDDADINSGVPVKSDGEQANTNGAIPHTTTAGEEHIGLSVDTNRTGSTLAQVAAGAGDRSDGNNASFVKVCVNPDAVLRAKFSGGATADTAISLITQATADATGLAPGPTVTDEAIVWGYEGANIGHARQADAANSVELAFPFDIAAGDTFLEAVAMIGTGTQTPTLTSAFTQVDASNAVAANDNFIFFDFELGDVTNDGQNKSFCLLVAQDHIFGCPGIIA